VELLFVSDTVTAADRQKLSVRTLRNGQAVQFFTATNLLCTVCCLMRVFCFPSVASFSDYPTDLSHSFFARVVVNTLLTILGVVPSVWRLFMAIMLAWYWNKLISATDAKLHRNQARICFVYTIATSVVIVFFVVGSICQDYFAVFNGENDDNSSSYEFFSRVLTVSLGISICSCLIFSLYQVIGLVRIIKRSASGDSAAKLVIDLYTSYFWSFGVVMVFMLATLGFMLYMLYEHSNSVFVLSDLRMQITYLLAEVLPCIGAQLVAFYIAKDALNTTAKEVEVERSLEHWTSAPISSSRFSVQDRPLSVPESMFAI
jgi:hypothetical protein